MTRLELAGVSLELLDLARTGAAAAAGGAGRSIVYLHSEHHFSAQRAFLDELCALGRVICPRHPGFDGRPPPDDFRTVYDLAYLYLDLIEHLDLHDVLLIGSSFGGWVALEMAVRNVQRIAGLGLVAPLGVKPGDRQTRDFADLSALPEEEVQRRLYAEPGRHAPDYQALDDDQMLPLALERQYLAWYAWRPYLHNPGLNRWLHRVRCPTLLLWGDRDGYAPPGIGQSLASLLPDVRLSILSGVGHYPQIERGTEVMAALSQFERDISPPSR